MTTVEFSDAGGVLRLRAQGHAAWDMQGHDLVCAGASMLAYTLLQSLRDAQARGWIEELDADVWDGGVLAEAVPRRDCAARIVGIYRTVLTGYRLLAEHYPENVRMEGATRGENENGLL